MRTGDATPILLVLAFTGSMLISWGESQAASVPDSAGVASLKSIFHKAESGTMMRILRTDSTLVEGSLLSTHGVELLNPETGDKEIVDLEQVATVWEMHRSKSKGQAIGGTFGLLVGVLAGGLGNRQFGFYRQARMDSAVSTGGQHQRTIGTVQG